MPLRRGRSKKTVKTKSQSKGSNVVDESLADDSDYADQLCKLVSDSADSEDSDNEDRP